MKKLIKNENIFFGAHIHILFHRVSGQQQALLLFFFFFFSFFFFLLHTMDPISFPTDASIFIEPGLMSVQLTINVITFHHDGSIEFENSAMTVVFPMAVLSNAIPVIPIPSAHPMWYMIHIFPTVPEPLPLEALLGC